jgi:hypothetical protein
MIVNLSITDDYHAVLHVLERLVELIGKTTNG